ncbi:hypothetical protein LTR53_017902, partial [Teratosphaeriaceae sp. CCFEE 6253]
NKSDSATITDVMIITAIKISIVNLDEASNDDYDEGQPYMTCTHISGRVYTQDPARSFDGVGKTLVPEHPQLPAGTWYYVLDPKKEKARIEVPFQRVLGRCYETAALTAWFTAPTAIAAPPSSFQAVNTKTPAIKVNDQLLPSPEPSIALSRGLAGILEARAFSQKTDIRIDRKGGKTWFWADSRIQQLDVHEVNGRFVGPRDPMRKPESMGKLRTALKALDGRDGGLEEYHAARKEREQVLTKGRNALGSLGGGLVATGAQEAGTEAGVSTDKSSIEEDGGEEGAEEQNGGETGDVMDLDARSNHVGLATAATEAMDLDDDEGDEEDAGAALAAFKTGGAKQSHNEIINLDSDDEMP